MSSASEPQKYQIRGTMTAHEFAKAIFEKQPTEEKPPEKHCYVILSGRRNESPEFEGAAVNLDTAKKIMQEVLEGYRRDIAIFRRQHDVEVSIKIAPARWCTLAALYNGDAVAKENV